MSTSVPPPGFAASPLGEPVAPPADKPPSPRRVRRGRMKVAAGGMALALVVVLALVLFGSTSPQFSGPVARAATLSSRTPGFRMRMSIQLTSPTLNSPITADLHGLVDLQDHATSMSLAMDFGAIPQVIQALGSSTLRMDMIMEGSSVYVKVPAALTSSLPTSGKQWLKVDLAKVSGLPGFSSLQSNPAANDPSHLLQYLRSASDGVVNEGQEQVDGFQTTHYHAQLSFDRLADTVPSPERDALQQELSKLQQVAQTSDFPIDVWIDSHQLVRRVVMSLDLHLPNGPSMHESVTMDVSHYGPQPRPVTPPPDQVQDLSGLAGAGGG